MVALVAGCGRDGVSDGGAVLPVGTYGLLVPADQARPGCINGELHIELVIDSGTLTRYRLIGGQRGRGQEFDYSVFRDTITLSNGDRTLTGRFEFDGERLRIHEIDGDRCEDLSDWTSGPFELKAK